MLDYNFFNQKYSEATKETAHILSELLCISPYCKEIEKFKVNFIGEIFETFKDIDIEGLSFYCIYIEFETFKYCIISASKKSGFSSEQISIIEDTICLS